MSDEEKKAVVYLKSYCINDVLYDNKHYEQIETVLNLIENQQKEIEELKKPKYIINCKTNEITKLTNDFVSKDKIKAKIEELEKEIIEDKKKNNDFWSDYSIYLDAQREGFQSLLEKE